MNAKFPAKNEKRYIAKEKGYNCQNGERLRSFKAVKKKIYKCQGVKKTLPNSKEYVFQASGQKE